MSGTALLRVPALQRPASPLPDSDTPSAAAAQPAFAPILANDFKRQWADIGPDAMAAVSRVGESGWYVLGDEVKRFEEDLAQYWGMRHATGVANGMDAIEISLRILGCGPGDRVLTTPLSAFATTLAIVKLGAIPVFVDTDDRGLIDLDRCEALLVTRPDIQYFVPVHLYGHALDLDRLRAMRDRFSLKIVEDCAQAAGASFTGKQGTATAGTVGQLAATSFYPTKNLGAMGDGGAILTNDFDFDAQARVLRFYGETSRYRHEEIGYNSRLDELQAGLLRAACLPRLNRWIERRREIAVAYCAGIQNRAITLPRDAEGSVSSWHLYPVQVEPSHRAEFLARLKAQGIGVGIHYPSAIPDQAALQGVPFEMADECLNAKSICASEVSLPIHPYLTEEEINRVIGCANAWVPSTALPLSISPSPKIKTRSLKKTASKAAAKSGSLRGKTVSPPAKKRARRPPERSAIAKP